MSGASRVVAALAALAVAANAAQLTPDGAQFQVNASSNYNQYWSRVDISPDGARMGFSFCSGQDPRARQMTIDGVALTSDLVCNPNLWTYIQDEAETAFAVDGSQLVAWSERNGFDGEQMGIFGRIYQPDGTPLGAEFQINQIWQASQWRPLMARRPGGGWVVSWSGDWDGDALFRLVNSDGTFASGDIQVNTFGSGAQVDTAPGVAPNGRMLMVFVDFSGFSGIGSGTNLWARLYDPNGVPLQAAPFPMLTGSLASGDQREPRVACDGLGRFIVTWEDQTHEGSGYGIYALVYDNDGVLLTPQPIHVNTTTASSQRNPRPAADALGNFVVTWEDWSAGNADVRAQMFDANFQPVGGELLVNSDLVGDQIRPSVAMHATSGRVVFTYEGPGVSTDVFARTYSSLAAPQAYCTAKLNSLGCTPAITWSGTPALSGVENFHVGAEQVLNNKNGLLFLGFAAGAQPFYGGTLCVQPPVVRTGVQTSAGAVGVDDCSGQYDVFFSHALMAAKGLAAGTNVFCQFWSRDPNAQQPIGLTDALSFVVGP